MTTKPTITCLLLRAADPNAATVVPVERDFRAMQEVVGGYIQPLRLTDEVIAYMHEDGKMVGAPVNAAANKVVFLANPGLADDDFLVGDVALFGLLDADGSYDSLEHDAPPSAYDLCRRAGLVVRGADGAPIEG